MSSPRIVIQQHANRLIVDFHVNQRISSEKLYDSLGGADALNKFSLQDHDPTTIQTALSFYQIEGVTGVGLDLYEVRITISPAFEWDEITPQVLDTIKKHLQWDDAEIGNYVPHQVFRDDSSEGVTGSGEDELVD